MFPKRDDVHVFCMINSGKPLSQTILDVLLFNAVDMFECRKRTQRIKSRQYDGIIESNLEPQKGIEYPVVTFEASLSTDQWTNQHVSFYVRVDDLDSIHLNQGVWGRVMSSMMGLPSLDSLPPEIAQAIREGKGGMIPLKDLLEKMPPELREAMMRKMKQAHDELNDDDEEPEWDTGEPTYG